MFLSSFNTSTFQNITQIVRILPPPPAWIVAKLGHARPQYFGDPARLEKRLEFGCATRLATPQTPCTELHGRYRTPKQLARYAKNPGKTFGFAAERTGTEQLSVFPVFLRGSRGAENDWLDLSITGTRLKASTAT